MNTQSWPSSSLSECSEQAHQDVAGAVRLLLSPVEAAKALSVSRSKLYRLLKQGRLESVRLDGNRRISMSSLESFVRNLHLDATPPANDKDLEPQPANRKPR
jgi:excisionase family DNA binding protein